MLAIATNNWYPSHAEYEANIPEGFGATIAVRYPQLCGSRNGVAGSIGGFFKGFLIDFDLDMNLIDYTITITNCNESEDISAGYPVNYFTNDEIFFDEDTCEL